MDNAISDERIRNKIMNRLSVDDRVDVTRIRLEVTGGKIKLSGVVNSLAEAEAARSHVRSVAGLHEVDDHLTVLNSHPVVTDEQIKLRVSNILLWSAELDLRGVDVQVEDGVLTLEGSVDAFWKRIRAQELASFIAGVRRIANSLVVVPTKDTTDQSIAGDVQAALQRSMAVDVNNINLKVENGLITLSGIVPTWSMYIAMEDTARFTAGVTGVRNLLIVE